ncbi:hypothetical protein K4F52_009320 [Lecanicillium sp. MT-2017a]|nr:hypothetical protein K4F52_009320 [Lecanicillium sp. MT-2017a]
MASHYVEKYIVEVKVAIAEKAIKSYDDLVNDRYDEKFTIYKGYIKSQVPDQVNAFIHSDKVDKYFNTIEGYASSKHYTETVKCPHIEHEVDMLSTKQVPNVIYTLKDEEGFWKDIREEYGI